MKRLRFLVVWVMVLTLLTGMAFTVQADVLLSNDTTTAYIGTNDYMYLTSTTGTIRVFQVPITDLVGMDDQAVYCLVQGGQLYSVKLDGSSSQIVSQQPTQEMLDSLKVQQPYTLTNGLLTVNVQDVTTTIAQANVLMAAANTNCVYYVETDANGIMSIKSYPLTLNPTTFMAASLVGPAMAAPKSMVATDSALILLSENGLVTIINLETLAYQFITLPQTDAAMIAVYQDQILFYTKDETGVYHYVGTQLAEGLTAPSPTAMVTASPSPSPSTKPSPTPRPTSKPDDDDDSGYSSVKYGHSGANVKNMQKRLIALGYPAGSADGVYGDNTLRALKLFQGDAGYTERSTATSALLEKLYSKSAPKYNEYKALANGKSGERVLIMQERLSALGYDPGKLDAVYGKNTTAAIEAFQKQAGLKVTGKADADTLKKLYAKDAPPFATPTPTPTATPTAPPQYNELKAGNTGAEVKTLNERLYALGYIVDYDAAGAEASTFTNNTVNAVNAFAAKTGLAPNGIATSALQAALYAGTAPYAYDTLKLNDADDAVLALKNRLVVLGYLEKFDTSASDAKQFNAATAAAVDAFAKQLGQSVNGQATPSLQVQLFRYSAPVKPAEPSESPSVGPSESPSVGPSESPSVGPSESPSVGPSESPSVGPSESPSVVEPSESPSVVEPSESPSVVEPSESPSVVEPSESPSVELAPIDAPVNVLADIPADVPADIPADVPADIPADVPADIPADVPADIPADVPADIPADVPADIPADVPADTAAYRTLSLAENSSGNDVLSLKQKLFKLGYLENDPDDDKDFNKNTETAIKAFQKSEGLEETGIATNDLQVLLFSK